MILPVHAIRTYRINYRDFMFPFSAPLGSTPRLETDRVKAIMLQGFNGLVKMLMAHARKRKLRKTSRKFYINCFSRQIHTETYNHNV